MNLILFTLTLAISFIVVRVGAIAFQLTGLEWSLAKFQALSCFSGTGFTTREAELITGHPQRRKIASILMVLGNVGLVTMIATVANSLRPRVVGPSPWLNMIWGGLGPLVNLLIIAVAIYGTWRILSKGSAAKRLTDYLRSKVQASGMVESISFEELLISTGGYGVARAEVREGSPVIGKTLAASGLRSRDITVLVVRKGDEAIPNPPAATCIECGDRLLCFGSFDRIREAFSPAEADDRQKEP